MRQLIVIFIIVLLYCPSTTCVFAESESSSHTWQDSQPPLLGSTVDIVNYAKPATVFIRHRDETGQQCVGTGFLVHKDGLVITCAHVVEQHTPSKPKATDKIWVRTYDGMVKEAERWTVLPESDVALLKIDVKEYPYLDIETSLPKLGEEITVIGYPLGQTLGSEPSITRGIVSAVRFSNKAYQLDAAVNPGNSGGPVLNKNGDVVGALSFKVRGAEGIAFAVSAELFQLSPSRDGIESLSGPTSELRDMMLRSMRKSHIKHNTRSFLFRAADAGDLILVQKLLAAGANVGVRDEDGDTPLIDAAILNRNVVKEDPGYRSRKLQIAKLLISNGANVNVADEWGMTALYWASSLDFPECVKLLLDHGAKVDGQNNLLTPLWGACVCKNLECAELLIKSGADVNMPDDKGRTILGRLKDSVEKRDDPHCYDTVMILLRKYGAKE